jgi:hypothetical protein
VNLAPRGEICPLGVKFTPSFTLRGEHLLLFRRMENFRVNTLYFLEEWRGQPRTFTALGDKVKTKD